MTTTQETGPGDGASFVTRVADKYWDPFYRYAYRCLGDHHAAQDVLQEAALKIYRVWRSRPELIEKNPGYCWRIYQNALRDHVRKSRLETLSTDRSDGVQPSGSTSPGENHVVTQVLLGHAFRVLPERHQEVFFLRHYAGFTTAEVAKMLGLGAATVSTYLASAKNQLSRWFTDMDA